MERGLVEREGVDFLAIQAGGLHGVGAAKAAKNSLRLARGASRAFGIVRQFKPDVVLLTGGFVGVPVSLAARAQNVPSLVYLPDIEPGSAVKLMTRFATKVATTTEASAAFIPKTKMVVTGYPVRQAFAGADCAAARAKFGILPDEKMLLVFGGSKGARNINRALTAQIGEVLKLCKVVHVTGAGDFAEVSAIRQGLSDAQKNRYRVFEYLHEEMAEVMAAADLAVCRAGASALGELPYVGLPAILVPYPYAWRYQRVNAEYLQNRGAAVMLMDENLNDLQTGLAAQASQLLNDTARLSAMRNAALGLARKDAAMEIARTLVALADGAQASPFSGGKL